MLVKIWTDSFIITGEIDTLRDERLTDYIRENKDFIAVTQVKVSDRNDKDLFRMDYYSKSLRQSSNLFAYLIVQKFCLLGLFQL